MDKWVRLSTGDARGARGLPAVLPRLGPVDPLSPLGALVNFIYTTLRIHTFASGGIASCTAHTQSLRAQTTDSDEKKKICPNTALTREKQQDI